MMLLAPGRGPDPTWLDERGAWWRAREAGFRAHSPIDVEPVGPALSADDHAQASAWLPLRPLVADVELALRAWFDASLAKLGGLDLATTDLAAWRSWLDARARLPLVRRFTLPSELLEALRDPATAHDLLFELAAPPSIGSDLGRYDPQHATLARFFRGGAAASCAAWDVGCGTGEGTWELAHALVARGAEVVAVGTTPCPLQALMAARRLRPHDPTRSGHLADFVAAGPRERCDVRFLRHDVLRDPPPGTFDAITCHGLLGEGIDDEGDITRVVTTLADTLNPGGVLSVTDRFRADRSRRAAELVERAACSAGLEPFAPGVFGRG